MKNTKGNKIKSITLSDDFKKEILYNSLCNGLGYVCSSYDLQWDVFDDFYNDARKQLKEERPTETICIEDILLRVLENGQPIKFLDLQSDNIDYLFLKDALYRMDNLPIDVINNFLNENDDADDADVVIQTCLFTKVIFG